jgi:hypothetical protein
MDKNPIYFKQDQCELVWTLILLLFFSKKKNDSRSLYTPHSAPILEITFYSPSVYKTTLKLVFSDMLDIFFCI